MPYYPALLVTSGAYSPSGGRIPRMYQFFGRSTRKFREPSAREVRRTPLLGTSANSGEPRESWLTAQASLLSGGPLYLPPCARAACPCLELVRYSLTAVPEALTISMLPPCPTWMDS